jgi:hypothetical protein
VVAAGEIQHPERKARWRGVAVPAEHGGWSLTLEPVLLGLLVAPSWSGVLLGIAALLAFMARTPLKLVLGDRRRGRRLARTSMATRIAALYLVGLTLSVAGAILAARRPFWPPLAVAAPLILVALAYDARSLSRRLVPELLGAVGIGSIAGAIGLAGAAGADIAFGLWLVVAARAVAAIVHVRVQLRRAKHRRHDRRWNDLAQAAAVAAVGLGVIAGIVPIAGLIALVSVSLVHVVLIRRPPARTPVIGAQQVVFGLTVVLATGLGAIAPQI